MPRGKKRAAPERKTYPAAKLPKDAKDTLARLAIQLEEEGHSPNYILIQFSEAGFVLSDRSYRRHKASMRETGHVESQAKQSGRHHTLTAKQVRILIGWVLTMNEARITVTRLSACTFIRVNFGKVVVEQTAGNYLHRSGFSPHKEQENDKGYNLTKMQMVDIATKDVCSLHRLGAFGEDYECWCIDFTYSSHHGVGHTSWSPDSGYVHVH